MLLLAQYTEENGIGLGKIFDKVKINAEDYSDIIKKIKGTSLGDVLDGDKISVEKLSKAIGTSDDIILGYAQTLKDTSGNIDLTTASTEGLSAYLEKSGNMFNFAAIKATLLNTALNAGIFLVASVAIQGIAKALDNYIHRVEKARERTDELFSEFKQMNDTLADHKKTVSELADRYDELSKGVSNIDNSNISLSDEEYNEFLDINKQLVDIFPELYDGLGKNGSSILNIGTSVQSASEYLQELIDKEEYLNNIKIASNLDELFKNVSIQVNDSNEKISRLEEELNNLDGTWENAKLMNAGDILGLDILEIGDDPELINAVSRSIQQLNDELYDQLQNNKIETDEYLNFVEQFVNPALYDNGASLFDGYVNLISLDDKKKERLQEIINEQTEDLMHKLEDSVDTAKGNIALEEQNTDAIWADLIPNLIAGMKSKANFQKLDDVGLGDFAVSIVEQLDAGLIKELKGTVYEDDIYGYVRDKILVPIQDAIEDENGNIDASKLENIKSKISSALNLKAAFDKNDIPIAEYADKIDALITVLEEFGMSPDIIKHIKLVFDYDDTSDIKDRINNSIRKITDDHGGIDREGYSYLMGEIDFDSLTQEQAELWLEAAQEAENAKEAVELYRAKLVETQQTASGTPVSLSFDDTINKLESIAKPVMSAIQDAWADAYDDEGVFKIDPSKALDAVSKVKDAVYSINSNKDLGIHIDTSSIQELSDVLTDTASTEEDVRQAYGNIADAVMNEFLPAMNGMDDAHIKVMQSFLEGLGISNAEELIIQQLGYTYETYTEAKQVAAQAGIDLADATVEDVMKFAEESTAAEEDKIALLDYYQYKIIASGATIDTNPSIVQLLAEYEQLGINCEKLKEYLGLHGAGAGSKVDLKYRGFSSSTEGYDTGTNTKPELPEIPKGIDDKRIKSAKEEVNVLSDLNSEMDKLQSAYKSLCDIKDTYNKYGRITVDQYQELTDLGFNFLANLVDENGQLGLNASAFERLAQAKLEEMQIQMARNAANAINGLRTEAAAVEYLTYATEQNRQAALGAAEAELQWAVAAAKRRGEQQGLAAEQIYQGYQASKQLAGSVDLFFDPSAQEKENSKEDDANKLLDAYNKEKSILEHMLALDQISKAEYYDRLMKLVHQYFNGDEEHQNQIWDVEEGYHDYLESIKETYNWIEIFLENLARKADALIDKAGKFITWSKKNAMINRAVKATDKQITGQTNAYAYYAEKARKVGLNNAYIDKIQNGTLTMEDMQNESLSDKIEKYQEWYDKMVACEDAVSELYDRERDLLKQKLDNVLEYYNDLDSYMSSIVSKMDSFISLMDDMGKRSSLTDLLEQFAAANEQIAYFQSKTTTTKKKNEKNYFDSSKEFNTYRFISTQKREYLIWVCNGYSLLYRNIHINQAIETLLRLYK